MKILVATGIYPPSIGGPATHARLVETELPKRGIDVTVLSFDLVRPLPKIIRHIVYAWRLFRLRKSGDVIYTLDPVSVGLPALIVSKISGRKLILRVGGDYAWEQGVARFGVTDVLDDFVKKNNYRLPVRLLKFVQGLVARGAAKVVVPSRYLAGIVSNWGVNPEKIVTIYNSYGDDVSKNLDKNELHQKLGLTGKVVITAGRFVKWKGFRTLITLVKDMAQDYKLFIAGSGPEEENLKKLVDDYKINNRVSFLGDLNKRELSEYMAAADVFVLNTNYEGLSHIILEVLSLGTPVVTTNVGGNPEIIENEINGLLVNYDDAEALRASIDKILADESLRNRIIANGLKTSAKFTKEKTVNAVANFLKENAQK
ncbi:MAG TPA: glycosyltransferase family 4 protein [Candidatus Paceibacterota bacterium]|nr:glycosyltransferase family 4 protein [Candidatus Paceibacterota bacterium]HRZ34703.1 glycosyltransferase family 4 protein [Candidatus Paceibacterota bacterium]